MVELKLPTSYAELLFVFPMYQPLGFDLEQSWLLEDLVASNSNFETYCVRCNNPRALYRPYRPFGVRGVADMQRRGQWAPSMDTGHKLIGGQCFGCATYQLALFLVSVGEKGRQIEKVGQDPSSADVFRPALARYEEFLHGTTYKELRRAVALHANGIGIGAFVYLRRIFENLVKEVHESVAATLPTEERLPWSIHMDDNIERLAAHLPPLIVKRKNLWNLLSGGIHEWTEDQCKIHFPRLQIAIEAILEQHIAERIRADTEAAADRAISDVASETARWRSEAVSKPLPASVKRARPTVDVKPR